MTRQAPAVRFPVRRGRAVVVLLAALVLAGAVVLMAWWQAGMAQRMAAAVATAVVAWMAAAVGAWHWWRSQFCGELHWDGQQWWLDRMLPGCAPVPLQGAPEVQWDLQSHLWVSALSAGQPRIWLWLKRCQQPERWPDLRRAVYSRAGTGAASAAEFAPTHSRQA